MKCPQETESSEVQETVESAEVQEEAAQLEQATFEPEATVELESRHQDAEVVEAAFTEAMLGAETTNAEDAELIPENDNAPGEDVMIDTVPLPEKPSGRVAIIDSNDGPRRAVDNNLHTASDEVSATPITLPGQERVGGQGGRPGGGVEATPINLPNPQDEVSATPITLPGQAREIEQSRDSVSIIDTNDGPRVAVDDGPRVVDNVDTVGIIDTNDGPRAMDEMVDRAPAAVLAAAWKLRQSTCLIRRTKFRLRRSRFLDKGKKPAWTVRATTVLLLAPGPRRMRRWKLRKKQPPQFWTRAQVMSA